LCLSCVLFRRWRTLYVRRWSSMVWKLQTHCLIRASRDSVPSLKPLFGFVVFRCLYFNIPNPCVTENIVTIFLWLQEPFAKTLQGTLEQCYCREWERKLERKRMGIDRREVEWELRRNYEWELNKNFKKTFLSWIKIKIKIRGWTKTNWISIMLKPDKINYANSQVKLQTVTIL